MRIVCFLAKHRYAARCKLSAKINSEDCPQTENSPSENKKVEQQQATCLCFHALKQCVWLFKSCKFHLFKEVFHSKLEEAQVNTNNLKRKLRAITTILY